jgi:hypothetical protein
MYCYFVKTFNMNTTKLVIKIYKKKKLNYVFLKVDMN